MSKLLEKLRRLGRGSFSGMGFRPALAEGPPLLLIPLLFGSEEPLPSHGDALALDLPLALSTSPPQEDIPWGVVAPAKSLKKEDLARLEEKGCDFLILTTVQVRVAVLEGKLARFLPLEPSRPDSWCRAAAGLGDGGVISLGTAPLTLDDLVQCRRLAEVFSRPVLALVPAGLSPGEARQIAQTGVLGIISPDLTNEKKFKQWQEALASFPQRPTPLLTPSLPPIPPERE